MSLRYSNGAIIKPGFNPVLIPGAPTIGAVTGGDTQVIVAFTAPTDTGGSAITSYQVVSSPGSVIATGASSPITVTGLANGTAYTFRVAAVNSYGAGTFSAASASATPVAAGQQEYITAGTFTWVAPAGVTAVSVVAVGAGARASVPMNCYPAGGGGGGLGYINNYTVIPGNSYTVVVGAGTSSSAGASSFVNTSTVRGGGGTSSTSPTGGTFTGAGGGNGGASSWDTVFTGGGGAGGYAGNGGAGSSANGAAGAGGGGGGGRSSGGGGGVGLLGQGSNGAGSTVNGRQGGGGSGGSGGACAATGALYGGGGSACSNGANGAVRIIWPGTTRSFPSTNTGNL